MRFIRVILIVILIVICSGCAAQETRPDKTPAPVATTLPTHAPVPTTTNPPPTATPKPQSYEVEQILENCEAMSANGSQISVEGNIFLPEFLIYGYSGWKGMNLTQSKTTDAAHLTVLIQVGQGPNRMDDLPIFFSERDLLVHATDERIIRHGHAVKLTGRLIYKADNPERRCELNVEEIGSMMPEEVLVPREMVIQDLYLTIRPEREIMPSGQQLPITHCADLSNKRQLVQVKGSILFKGYEYSCEMGYCRIRMKDETGDIGVTIVEGDGPNSMILSAAEPAPGGWKIFNTAGLLANLDNLTLTGILYSEGEDCRLMVYRVE